MKSNQKYRGKCWRILATTSSSGFAWDVIRLRYFDGEKEVKGEAVSSGNAVIEGTPTYYSAGHALQEGANLWGGRPDQQGHFWIGINAGREYTLVEIRLEQGLEHWVSSLAVQVLQDDQWSTVQQMEDLSPGVNQLSLSLPPDEELSYHPTRKYSMIILNYRRPKNVIEIIEAIKDYDCLDEIVISNALEETAITYTHPKVVIKDDYVFDPFYGLDRRFLNGLYCKHENILFLDDDNIISENDMLKLIAEYERDPNRMVCAMGRNNYWVRKKLVYKSIPFFHEVDYALSPLVMQRVVCQLFFYCKPIIEDLYRQGTPYGNVDDLYSSFVAGVYYQRKHYCVPDIEIITLEQGSVAVSRQKGHFSFRSEIINALMDKREVFEAVVGNFRALMGAVPVSEAVLGGA